MNGHKYRADIDGLRAIAVLPVVLFHANFPGFSGGFLGVDIFFVISGYLITQVILADVAAGRFSIASFYERRIRRIVPALGAMLLATAVAGLFLLFPSDMVNLCDTLVAAILFVSNMQLWHSTGYFAPIAEMNPLLHTWSLAVEEQFYLFFPLFVAAGMAFFSRLWRGGMLVMLIASLLLGLAEMRAHGPAVFYLLPTRAWEIMLGALLAAGNIPTLRNTALANVLACLGAILVLAGLLLTRNDVPFPLSGLAPAAGSALLLYSGTHVRTVIARALAWRPVVAVGLISYSVYLWHWPLIVYLQYVRMQPLTPLLAVLVLAFSLALGWLSWRYVERPFRKANGGFTRPALFLATAACGLVLAAGGIWGHVSHGITQRYGAAVVMVDAYHNYPEGKYYRDRICFLEPEQKFSDLDRRCLAFAPDRKNLLLWGDSHAAHYYSGLAGVAPGYGLNLLQANASACPPIPGLDIPGRPNCESFNTAVLSFVRDRRPNAVILSAYWTAYGKAQLAGLASTVESLRTLHIPVIIIGPSIEFITPLPNIAARAANFGHNIGEIASNALVREQFVIDTRMKAQFQGKPGVTYVSISDAMCANRICPAQLPGGELLTWDNAHLTGPGSALVVGRALAPALAALGRRQWRSVPSHAINRSPPQRRI